MSNRESPGGGTGATPKHRANGYFKSNALTRLYGHDRHEPMTAEDREDLAVIVAAVERGYRIAVRCRVCGHWLSNPMSVKAFVGPRCAAKAVAL